jgi:pyruvate/2-oxoglutarate dehydrogenase complex dihydrolipoamide dehydrogenase (E3) component
MMSDDVFDVIVIGAGPAGEIAAARAVRGGLTAAVVERRLVGGECHYYGCVPSKALLWPMEVAAAVSRMPGLKLDGPIDAAAVAARRDDFVGHYHDGPQVSWVQSVPAAFVRGEGRLAGPLRVEVSTPEGGGRKLEARHAVVLGQAPTRLSRTCQDSKRHTRGRTGRQPASPTFPDGWS